MPRPPRPLFATALFVLGVLALINSFFFLVLGFDAARAPIIDGLALSRFYDEIMLTFASTACGAVLIGFSQMLTFTACTAFYAEQCANLLRSQCVNAPGNHGGSDKPRE